MLQSRITVSFIRTKSNFVVFLWGVLARDSDCACLRNLSNLFRINYIVLFETNYFSKVFKAL